MYIKVVVNQERSLQLQPTHYASVRMRKQGVYGSVSVCLCMCVDRLLQLLKD